MDLRAGRHDIVTIWPMTDPTPTAGPDAAPELSAEVAAIAAGYTFDEPAIDLGVVVEDGDPATRGRRSASR